MIRRPFTHDRDAPPSPRTARLSAGLTGVMQDAARDTASPLDPGVRSRLEARVGHDFSRVRVH